MPTLHSFLRFSTPEQALGDSERRQIEDMRRWAAANGYDFSDSYRAPGISGFRGKQRKILQKFFDDVQSGRFPKGDALGVENFDRLSREPPLDSFDLFRQIVKSGVPLVVRGYVYTEETLRREPWRFHEILGELNRGHSESVNKSERGIETNAKKRRDAREHKKPFGGKRCPGWLRLSDDGNESSRSPRGSR